MPRLFTPLSLIAALTFSTALYAQETETTETTSETVQTQAPEDVQTSESTAGADLDLGEKVIQDPTYIKETYGDWQLKCFRSEGQDDVCQMYQLLSEAAGNPIAEFSLFKLPANSQAIAGATIVVPLGTLLTQEMQISIDGGQAKTFAYSFCSVAGCFARIGLSQEDLEAFKRGAAATLQIVPAQAPDQRVAIPVSLSGFTAAYDNVSTIEN